jgi:hypothetical protein
MKLKYLIESYTHKISIYPIISVIYDGEVQAEYEFKDDGQVIEIQVCLRPDEGVVSDKFVQSFMNDIKFDELGPLRDKAFEKFKGEKFLVDPEKLTKEKVQIKSSKGWEYAEEEKKD